MSRLIDADALKVAHGMKDDCADCDKELRGKSRSCEFDRIYSLMDFCGWLDDAPTIEPERKNGYRDGYKRGKRAGYKKGRERNRNRGEWTERNVIEDGKIDALQYARCSVCGKYHTTPYLYSFTDYAYCPNCGARMKEGETDGQNR